MVVYAAASNSNAAEPNSNAARGCLIWYHVTCHDWLSASRLQLFAEIVLEVHIFVNSAAQRSQAVFSQTFHALLGSSLSPKSNMLAPFLLAALVYQATAMPMPGMRNTHPTGDNFTFPHSGVLGLDLSQSTSLTAFKCLVNEGYHFAIVRAYQSIGK